jgi:hypothetical protein
MITPPDFMWKAGKLESNRRIGMGIQILATTLYQVKNPGSHTTDRIIETLLLS